MNDLIESCIFPIMEGQDGVGQGFIADGYFITAAHVIINYPRCFVRYRDRDILLSKETPLYIGTGDIEKDFMMEDVAIYDLEVGKSFLPSS